MAKRRSSSSFNFRTTAPKENTAILSIIIFAIGVIAWAASIVSISPYIPWLLALAYIVLLAGVLMKDL
jgi:fatty acid desaturase